MLQLLLIIVFGAIFLAPNIFISKFYTFQSLLAVMGVAICTLFLLTIKKHIKLTINSILPIVISVIGVALYTSNALTDISGLLLIVSAIVLICDNIEIDKKYKVLFNVFAIYALLEALYGFGQFFNLLNSNSSFRVTGTFDNPAGFAICLSMLLPFVLYKDENDSYRRWSWKGIVAFLLIIAVVISGARTGILSMFAIIVIWLYKETNLLSLYKRMDKWKRVAITSVISVAFILLLYIYKLDSANGRLLIWKVSTNMILNAPFLGSGTDSFNSEYMLAQGDYFLNNPDSKFVMLADNVKHVFNEYISLLVKYGFVGMILIISYSIFVIRSYKSNEDRYKSPALYSIMAFLVVSLSSYPLNYPFVWLLIAISIGIISKGGKELFSLPIVLRPMLIVIIGILFIRPSYHKWIDENEWHTIANLSLSGKTEEVLPRYERLYGRMNNHGLFLYNYGAELAYIGKYEESNEVLERCECYLNDADVQVLIANNYISLKEYDKAESRLISAYNMVPNRFVPLYRLMMLYDKTAQIEKATNVATRILDKDIKIYSETIMSIRKSAKDILNKYNH